MRKTKYKPDDCELVKMDTEKLCVNCFSDRESVVRKYTKYWCRTCEEPLCPTKCYDMHRREKYLEDDDIQQLLL